MKFQIGKAGVTQGAIDSLALAFKTHKSIRIAFLKGSGRDREIIKEMAQEIADKLPGEYKYTIIGFTVVMRRSRKKEK